MKVALNRAHHDDFGWIFTEFATRDKTRRYASAPTLIGLRMCWLTPTPAWIPLGNMGFLSRNYFASTRQQSALAPEGRDWGGEFRGQ